MNNRADLIDRIQKLKDNPVSIDSNELKDNPKEEDYLKNLRMEGQRRFGGMSEMELSTTLLILQLKVEDLTRENEFLKNRLDELS